MTRVSFVVASSSFAVNVTIKQNATDHVQEYSLAALAAHDSFYVDDGLTGADSLEEATKLQEQLKVNLKELFAQGRFLLRMWKSSEPSALRDLPTHLLDP